MVIGGAIGVLAGVGMAVGGAIGVLESVGMAVGGAIGVLAGVGMAVGGAMGVSEASSTKTVEDVVFAGSVTGMSVTVASGTDGEKGVLVLGCIGNAVGVCVKAGIFSAFGKALQFVTSMVPNMKNNR